MSLEVYLKRLKSSIDRRLGKYLPAPGVYPSVVHRAMRYSVLSGGKRVRPILAIESCKVCGGSASQIMPAACAIELVHNYSLIHDDLPAMDNDDYRRGRPSVHKKYGEANAILAGDGLLTLVFNILARDSGDNRILEVIKELSEAIGTLGLIGGQVVDLQSKNKMVSRKRRYFIDLNKTAKLFAASAKIGAIIGGGTGRQVASLGDFGRLLGLSFQAIDDIIDRGKDGIPGTGGPNNRFTAERYLKDAKMHLAVFGGKADRLRALADYLLTRKD